MYGKTWGKDDSRGELGKEYAMSIRIDKTIEHLRSYLNAS